MVKVALILILVSCLIGCFYSGKTANLGEEFIIRLDETTIVKDTDLRMKVISNGHVISGRDIPFCEFEVEFKDKMDIKKLDVGGSTEFQNLIIKLQRVDTTVTAAKAPIESGASCNFIVTRSK